MMKAYVQSKKNVRLDKQQNCNREKADDNRAEFAVAKIFAFLLSYLVTLSNSNNFKFYCFGFLILTIIILADFLVVLHKSNKNKTFHNICTLFLTYYLTILLISILGCLNVLKYEDSLILNTAGKSIRLWSGFNINFLCICPFGLVSYYILEHVGSLE